MIRPNQVLSQFREGLDTLDLAIEFGITEGDAYNLLDESRRTKPDWSMPKVTAGVQRRAVRKALLANRSKKPVSLLPLSFLEGKS